MVDVKLLFFGQPEGIINLEKDVNGDCLP
jgi:hypothetical protein